MRLVNSSLSERTITILEFSLIVVTAAIPLLFQHPYRINLFLAWEGAYRMSNGEIPYRDFGSPVGYGFWILPAIFFRIFGPYVFSLLITQAFINIGSGLVFRALLRKFQISPGVRFLSVLVYCLSYSMFNFWPWYNHLVFVVELTSIYLLCSEILKAREQRKSFLMILSGFLAAFSFLIKQDTGALALIIGAMILVFDFTFERNFRTAIIFMAAYAASMFILIAPFLQYEFSYWFNFGQHPHNPRVDKFDLINEFFGASTFIKFYLLVFVVIVISQVDTWYSSKDKKVMLFALIVLCILAQATIIQVTSYTPIDGNIYFHSFAFAFILQFAARNFDLQRVPSFAALSFFVVLWWSGVFWTRFLKDKVKPMLVSQDSHGNVISKNTYLLTGDTLQASRSKWVVPSIPTFRRIKIPADTERGALEIMKMPEARKPGAKILNMSELTPLAYDMKFELERGASYPLWFHKGVSFFDREVETFCKRVENQDWDVILFEDIPNVNQFYPYEVRDCIKKHYKFRYKFLAPRVPEISYIEVYTKE